MCRGGRGDNIGWDLGEEVYSGILYERVTFLGRCGKGNRGNVVGMEGWRSCRRM